MACIVILIAIPILSLIDKNEKRNLFWVIMNFLFISFLLIAVGRGLQSRGL